MSIKLNFDVKRQLSETIWEVKAAPNELCLVGKPKGHSGGPSVLFIDSMDFNSELNRIECEMMNLDVVNLGTSNDAIVINTSGISNIDASINLSPSSMQDKVIKKNKKRILVTNPSIDKEFLERLSESNDVLYRLGTELLSRIRKHYHGNLVFKKPRFVESPDNFWTITVQDKRTSSLRITLYGKPEDFIQPPEIKIQKDRGSYSAFVVDRYAQIEPAAKLILESMEMKIGRR